MVGILIDEDSGDLLVRDGRIEIGDNALQCVEQILKSSRGEYKEFPLVGGECYKLLHGICPRFWPNRFKQMCNRMGISVKRVEVSNQGKITIGL